MAECHELFQSPSLLRAEEAFRAHVPNDHEGIGVFLGELHKGRYQTLFFVFALCLLPLSVLPKIVEHTYLGIGFPVIRRRLTHVRGRRH